MCPSKKTRGKHHKRKEQLTMGKITSAEKNIEQGVVTGYKAIENGVVKGYKAIENGVVKGYKAIEDKFVETFLPEYKEAEEKNNVCD